MAFRADFRQGVAAISPLLPPAATVGVAAGVAAATAGLSTPQALAMSVVVYFPSVMLTALDLLDAGAPPVVVVSTSLVVGVRVVLLSLSIAPYLGRLPTRWKWALAYFLWTPVYALTVGRFSASPTADVRGFYLGMALPLWVTLQASVVAGAAFSAGVPPGLELEFIVPLAFIALLEGVVSDRAGLVAAVAGGVLAVVAAGVPLGLGIVLATVGGTAAGLAASARGRNA